MIIIGIDPGTATTGYGIIEAPSKASDGKPKVIDFGCINTSAGQPIGERLKTIYQEINILIKKYGPELMAIENIYFFKNFTTAMPVSQAKGVVLLAAANHNIPVKEFTPLQLKMTMVGYGRAEKKQVQQMTKELLDFGTLNLKEGYRKKDDAFDALGIALCGLIHQPLG